MVISERAVNESESARVLSRNWVNDGDNSESGRSGTESWEG
jgi:hypothetical protein